MSSSSENKKTITDLFCEIRPLNIGPYNYWYTYLEEAVYCFLKEHYIASILVSSAAVETVLFWEYIRKESGPTKRTIVFEQDPPSRKQRVSLALLFDKLKGTEVPLELLLTEDEKGLFDSLRESNDEGYKRRVLNRMEFIKTRNKFAHASLFGVISKLKLNQFQKIGMDIHEPWVSPKLFRDLAFVQLKKTLCFMKASTESKSSVSL